ncbi:DUF397 domain-containing protein [Actinomadura macrotermitis]|uniref:DUF397 domain-containing protein n=1 Tax=Actinomadura macrotermitis TaxID=2585200 RepID=A0A7K0BQ16_9ACTN|nr:DUF397 domain-containing protein [Actinomadura macrotermitis]MQY03253.1 hypothetical protein [Actinomadura macrotermitis]
MEKHDLIWRKSSHSGGNSGQCVEIAQSPTLIGIRDSKNPDAGHLALDHTTFAALIDHLKASALDL